LLGLFIIPAIRKAQAKDIEQDHLRFYRSGTVLDVSEVLALSSMGKGTIKEVTVRYNMIRSNLEADWLYNGQVIGHTPMPKGVKKSIRFTYNQPLPGAIAVRFTGRRGQVQVSNVSALVIEIGEGGELIEESEIDKQQKYNLLSKIIKISPATKRKDIKLAYEVKEHLIQKIIEQNLIDEKAIHSNISENNAISILADRDTVTISGQIKSKQGEKIVTKNLKEAAKEVVDVKYIRTEIHVIVLPVYTLLPFVPNVVGKSRIEAEEIIARLSFVNNVTSYIYYKEEYQGQEGRVVSQSPESGTQIPQGSEVNIIVYDPPSIPNVVGKSQIEAEEIIKQAGYQSEVEFQTNYVPQYQRQVGKVVSQSPKAGTRFYEGSNILITVYSPYIPSVVGELQRVAEERIKKSGFLPKVEFHTSYNRDYRGYDGKVALQSPEAGTQMPQGSEVNITVYIHPSVPNVVGKSQIEAEELIKKTGYLPEVENFTDYLEKYQGQEGRVVVLQRPEAGTERYQGSSITIAVYNPSIPSVVGNSQKVAEERIEKRGFLPKVESLASYKKEYQGQEGRVVLQRPEAGTQMPQGSEVNITVYNPASIPNVVNKSQIEAEEIIKKTGYLLEVKYFTSYLEKYQGQEGKVVLQKPEAEREEYQGSSITITVYNPSTLIPSVVGKFQKRAEELIEKSGYLPKVEFHVSYKKEYQGQEGKVISQSPEAGIQIPQGSYIKITVYTYSPMADLEIESISYQDPLFEGERQSFSMIVRNSGDAFPEKLIPDVLPISIRVGLWYKGPGDSDWKQFQFPHTGMINIKPGKTHPYTFHKDANNSLPSGDYLIRGIVDEHEQLKDKNFQNNLMEKEITIAPSPILLKSFPERAAWGQKILLEISTGKDLKDPEHPVSLSVKFNDVEGALDNIGKKTWREYTLSVVVPDGATSGPISVSGYGVTGRSKDNIIIFGLPTITEISPQAASVKSTITIKGTYFANFSEEERTLVGFPTDRGVSDEKKVEVTWISENEIRVKVPDEAKSGPLSIYTMVGSRQFSTTSETSFQILPRITGFSPKYGYVGKEVWIGGTSIDFERNPRVKFNGVETEIKKISGNTLEVIVPEGASTGKIEIITDEGVATSEEDFRVFASPTINSIFPLKGPEGTVITIEGNDLDLVNQSTISIPSSNTGSSLEVVGIPTRNRAQVRIPSGINHPGNSKINVKIPPGFWSNKVDFELTHEGMHLSRPQIESLSPSMITSGDSVILKVIKLPNPEVGVISVYFNGVSGEVKEIIGRGKYFELIVKVPEGATSGKVTLSTYGIDASGGASVLIFGQPTITGISPGAAPIGSYITIRGTEFVPNRSGNATLVSFISASGQQIEVNPAAYLGDTEIRVKVPKNAVSGPITVTTIVSGHKFTTTSEIDFIVE